MKGIKEWSESWSLWFRSPTFIPGLALALLFTNVFQLSYIAQGYITLHCISDVFMGMLIYAAYPILNIIFRNKNVCLDYLRGNANKHHKSSMQSCDMDIKWIIWSCGNLFL